MGTFIKRNLLITSVFITGACVLIVEVVATRVLSPYFGNSIFTVSSVISVILAALSLGYYLGGRLADRHPSYTWFFGIIFVSGITVLVFHLIGLFVLPYVGYEFPITSGPLVSSLLLFFLPALLLGTLSPYAVKLQSVVQPAEGVGSVAGRVFFWSTLGSIVGSLLAGFALIPSFGIDHIVIGNGLVLTLLGLVPLLGLGLGSRTRTLCLLVGVLAIGTAPFAVQYFGGHVLYHSDGVYERLTIYDGTLNNRPTRFFQQDRTESGAMYLDTDDPGDLAYGYTKYYALYKAFTPNLKSALVIGGGAYSIPKALLAQEPGVTVDVAEIEPSLFALAHEYFRAPATPRLHNYVADGRRLLHDADKRYDLIFSDVYYSLFSIPAHFTTQEFFTLAKSKLAPDGVFMANMIGGLTRQQPSLLLSEIKTFQTVFPNSYFFAVDSPSKTTPQNIIIVGYNSDRKIDFRNAAMVASQDPLLRTAGSKLIDLARFELSPYPILTDNYSPVDYMTARVLQMGTRNPIELDGNEMMATVAQQLRYGPRYLSAVGHEREQTFLTAELKAFTSAVDVQTWLHQAPDGRQVQLTNIIAHFYPEQTRRVILATHYDSQRFAYRDPAHMNQPVPGADNPASSVAVLVELARAFSLDVIHPRVGVDIVFFDGEEGEENQHADFSHWQPLGSSYFAQHLKESYVGQLPFSGVVLDTVGSKGLRLVPELSSVQAAPVPTQLFWSLGQKVDSSVFVDQVGSEIHDDHTPLNQAGIPSFVVIDYDYPSYATTQDTLDKCSPASLQTVAWAVRNYVYAVR